MNKKEKIVFGGLIIGIVFLSGLCWNIHNENQNLKKQSEYWKVLARVYEKLADEYFDMIDWGLDGYHSDRDWLVISDFKPDFWWKVISLGDDENEEGN